ncbi:unnamed protein product [Prorocentrum cordatum]|uniref:Uncharacterized protein n=1 Tax=Prorocentrum cordatum TaxID=2364126 RepID=A0ABN9RAA0_9DINO|nr:unnamed protein product [Polarella glacialis]
MLLVLLALPGFCLRRPASVKFSASNAALHDAVFVIFVGFSFSYLLQLSSLNLLTLVLTPLASCCTLYMFDVPTFVSLESSPIHCMPPKPFSWPTLMLAALVSSLTLFCTLFLLVDPNLVSMAMSLPAFACIALPLVAIVFLPLLSMLMAFRTLYLSELLAVTAGLGSHPSLAVRSLSRCVAMRRIGAKEARSIPTKTFCERWRAMRRTTLPLVANDPAPKTASCTTLPLVANDSDQRITSRMLLPLEVPTPLALNEFRMALTQNDARAPLSLVANDPASTIAPCTSVPLVANNLPPVNETRTMLPPAANDPVVKTPSCMMLRAVVSRRALRICLATLALTSYPNCFDARAGPGSNGLGAKPTKAGNNLGADFCMDGSSATGAPRNRRAKARDQLARVAGAQRRSISAATRLLAGGLLRTTARGCSERWRLAVGTRTFGSARGRSLQVDVALSAAPRRDPLCSQAELALLAHGRGFGRAHPDTTHDVAWAWRHAVQVRHESRPAAVAGRGTAAAALLAIERLGWTSTALQFRATDNGTALKLGRRPRRGARPRRDLRRGDPRSPAAAGNYMATPEQWARRRFSTRDAALAELWPVARRAALGRPLCRSSARRAGRGGRGAVRHLAWRRLAPALERRDAIAGDAAMQAFADWQWSPTARTYSRALIPDPTDDLPPPLETEEARWSRGFCYTALAGAGALCADGSDLRGKAESPEVRASWGPAAPRDRGAAHGACRGCARAHLPQNARAGGILAPLPARGGRRRPRYQGEQLLRRGPGMALHRPRMEAWREFWQAVGDIGGPQCARVAKRQPQNYEVNRAAAGLAKRDAALHPANTAEAASRASLVDEIAAATARRPGGALQLVNAAFTAADGADASTAEPTTPPAAGAAAGGGGSRAAAAAAPTAEAGPAGPTTRRSRRRAQRAGSATPARTARAARPPLAVTRSRRRAAAAHPLFTTAALGRRARPLRKRPSGGAAALGNAALRGQGAAERRGRLRAESSAGRRGAEATSAAAATLAAATRAAQPHGEAQGADGGAEEGSRTTGAEGPPGPAGGTAAAAAPPPRQPPPAHWAPEHWQRCPRIFPHMMDVTGMAPRPFGPTHRLWMLGAGARRLVHCAARGRCADGPRDVDLRARCAEGADARQAAALRRARQGTHRGGPVPPKTDEGGAVLVGWMRPGILGGVGVGFVRPGAQLAAPEDLAHSHLDTTGFGIGVVRGSHLIRTRCSRQTASAPDLAAWDPSRTVAAARQEAYWLAEGMGRDREAGPRRHVLPQAACIVRGLCLSQRIRQCHHRMNDP